MCTYSSKVPQVNRERVNLPGLVIPAIAGVLAGYYLVQVWHKDKREEAKKSFEQKALNQKKTTRLLAEVDRSWLRLLEEVNRLCLAPICLYPKVTRCNMSSGKVLAKTLERVKEGGLFKHAVAGVFVDHVEVPNPLPPYRHVFSKEKIEEAKKLVKEEYLSKLVRQEHTL
ncbi:hypothetical protein AALP_AA3G130300 [Arabis alpina]|uniref:Uncharacterized protein n=1 Tax=Arabis alpina TaxID=50452 RepID=A0A087H8W5_ARAAL|nr:hypothetical protein AALP_AA3G130300 [Arabis alpina]